MLLDSIQDDKIARLPSSNALRHPWMKTDFRFRLNWFRRRAQP